MLWKWFFFFALRQISRLNCHALLMRSKMTILFPWCCRRKLTAALQTSTDLVHPARPPLTALSWGTHIYVYRELFRSSLMHISWPSVFFPFYSQWNTTVSASLSAPSSVSVESQSLPTLKGKSWPNIDVWADTLTHTCSGVGNYLCNLGHGNRYFINRLQPPHPGRT